MSLHAAHGRLQNGRTGIAESFARFEVRLFADHARTDHLLHTAIRIGDQAIVTLPFETFVEIGLEIKEKSPFRHNLVIELANGSYGYLPTPKHHKLGGYETWLGTNKVQQDASDILTRHLLEMLKELHELAQ